MHKALRVAMPSVVAPSLKMTVPVAAIEPCVVTVAVKVIGEPRKEGFALEARVVVVDASVIWLSRP